MNPRPCCQTARPNSRPASRWRRGGEMAGWILPGATLLFLPKCPVCVAAYVMLFSGLSLSLATAAHLRTSLIILSVAILLGLGLKRLCRLISRRNRGT